MCTHTGKSRMRDTHRRAESLNVEIFKSLNLEPDARFCSLGIRPGAFKWVVHGAASTVILNIS